MALATEHGITLHNGSIRICYGPKGELYCVPMYLINPPIKYGNAKEEAEEPVNVEAENLMVTLFLLHYLLLVESKAIRKGRRCPGGD